MKVDVSNLALQVFDKNEVNASEFSVIRGLQQKIESLCEWKEGYEVSAAALLNTNKMIAELLIEVERLKLELRELKAGVNQ